MLKVVFLTCGSTHLGGLIRSPSGHTASAALVYGGIAAILVQHRYHRWSWAMACPLLAALLVGYSRLALGAHTLPEVLIGALVGCLAVAGLLCATGSSSLTVPFSRLLLPAVIVAVMLHGYHLHAEERLQDYANSHNWLAAICRGNDAPRHQ